MKARLIAALFLSSSCALATPAATLQAGLDAIARADYVTAARALLPLAEQGDVRAQLEMGRLRYHGLGVSEDDRQARLWFSRAAAQGLAEAQYRLGSMYAFGQGVGDEEFAQADERAAHWLQAAAVQGHAEAQYALGILFATGKGVARDESEALRWMRRAAELGHGDALNYVRSYTPSR